MKKNDFRTLLTPKSNIITEKSFMTDEISEASEPERVQTPKTDLKTAEQIMKDEIS
jgi:hypothetical protein